VGLLLGGIGTVWGALIGIPIIRLAPQLFDRFSTYQELIYGVVIVGMVLALPDGIVGGMRRFGRRVGVTLSRYPEESSGAVAKDGDAGRLHVVLERSDLDPASAVVGTRLDIATVVLSAQNISKRFGGIQALSDVALSARSGSIVGLIGPNGAGKSTFLSVLAGGLTPDTGQIHLQGRDITGFDAASRAASGLSRTFQLPRIPHHMSVLELATLGAHRRGSSGAIRAVLGATGAERRALEQAGMEALEKTGIAHLSTLPASKLSTGEQKLLELARALAASPEVLLADEPAGGLFDEEIARLGEVLNSLTTNGLAVVLVEHHMNLVMDVCSEICVLQEGRVIAVGSPAEIQTNHQVLDAYLGV
jgi:ABC-type branched-subunit amino acid transport system ATPase component